MPTATSQLKEIVCDEDWLGGLADHEVKPRGVVEPGTGFILSMDPGSWRFWDGNLSQNLETEGFGALMAVHNGGTKTLNLEVSTSWNVPNARWNVHGCSWTGTQEQLFEKAKEWQSGEKKPFFGNYSWDQSGLHERN
ncbi:hypothetical protein KKG63_00325 [Patescibacteria group bacterium]|nr:hypothetical protein [Patescibacteria group bacterium]